MEVRVKLDGLDKLKFSTKMEDDDGIPRLKTVVSFEVEGKIESLARLLHLARQRERAPLYAVVGCEQAMFDLDIREVREEDKRAAQAQADKAKAEKTRKAEKKAAPKPLDANAAGVKVYRVTYRPTGELRDVASSSAQGACELCGWMIGECHVEVVVSGAELQATEEEASATEPEQHPFTAAAMEALHPAGNGQNEASKVSEDDVDVVALLAGWMQAHALPEVDGHFKAPCPFHGDKGRSLNVWLTSDASSTNSPHYHCRVCGSSGELRRLAERLGLVVEAALPF